MDVRLKICLALVTANLSFSVCFLRLDNLKADLGDLCDPAFTYQPKSALEQCRTVARGLLRRNYYSGLLEAIRDCRQVNTGFIVLDCPSGTGKTLAGVALRELDCFRSSNMAGVVLPEEHRFRVVHVIWEAAISSQDLYRDIMNEQDQEGVTAGYLFPRAKKFLTTLPVDPQDPSSHVIWKEVLQFVFNRKCSQEFNLEEFKKNIGLSNRQLIIFIDEVPIQDEDVKFVGAVRDMLCKVPGILVILSGTHSKAANMIGLRHGAASRRDYSETQPWALLFTRLPAFCLKLSGLSRSWRSMQRAGRSSYHDDTYRDVISAIESAIDNGGNPWLIYQAIAVAENLIQLNHEAPSFYLWQTSFSKIVQISKFCFSSDRWSTAFPGLVGQLNLLLEGSATADLSDVLIGEHLALRAVPDGGLNGCATNPGVRLDSCGGWLYISSRRCKILRQPLYFVKGPFKRELSRADTSIVMWQSTMFPSVQRDLLVYLSSCRREGYFSVRDRHDMELFSAHEVVQQLWSHNCFGAVNYQNPAAVVNSGCLLEILLVAAASNAAAQFNSYSAKVSEFLFGLITQLGISVSQESLLFITTEFSADETLKKVNIPRCLFPGHTLPAVFSNTIGLLHRVPNKDKYDLLLHIAFGQVVNCEAVRFIRLEAKDRLTVSNFDIAQIATKLVRETGEVGILVVSNCCGYWAQDRMFDYNRIELLGLLNKQGAQHLGKIYFISHLGDMSVLQVSERPGRLILIRVPANALHLN